jgi:hypothetical protein
MSTHMTKTWFVDGEFIKQEIPETEIYKREWVGLTDEEIQSLPVFYEDRILYQIVKLAEAKLKEKNT